MAECTCFELPPEMWHTHYGAVEPGSTHEPNPECPEHFPKNKQYCKDCLGAGRVRPADRSVWFMDCPTCDGTGTIHRTGPYRLADGTWSDGIDRTAWLRDWAYGRLNPNRVTVGCWSYGTDKEGREVREGFVVYRGNNRLMNGDAETFPTFAEAVAYADRMARTNQGENK